LVREKKIGNTRERRYIFEACDFKLSRRLPMLCDLSEVKIIRNQMRYNRNLEIRPAKGGIFVGF
jgi:hypothetical protein